MNTNNRYEVVAPTTGGGNVANSDYRRSNTSGGRHSVCTSASMRQVWQKDGALTFTVTLKDNSGNVGGQYQPAAV